MKNLVNNTEYYIPTSSGRAVYEEKRSRFISYLEMVETEEQAKAFIADIKKKTGTRERRQGLLSAN